MGLDMTFLGNRLIVPSQFLGAFSSGLQQEYYQRRLEAHLSSEMGMFGIDMSFQATRTPHIFMKKKVVLALLLSKDFDKASVEAS